MYYSPYAGAGAFGTILSIIGSLISWLISNAALALTLIGLWFTFKKMYLPGWKGIIPFYNSYILFEKLWDVKQFWRFIIYVIVYVVSFIFGIILFGLGGIFAVAGGRRSFEIASVIPMLIGLSFMIAAVVMIILAMVIMFRLYQRLAQAFALKSAWAWGLLFVPYIMLPIIAFNRKIVYYGPVNQAPYQPYQTY